MLVKRAWQEDTGHRLWVYINLPSPEHVRSMTSGDRLWVYINLPSPECVRSMTSDHRLWVYINLPSPQRVGSMTRRHFPVDFTFWNAKMFWFYPMMIRDYDNTICTTSADHAQFDSQFMNWLKCHVTCLGFSYKAIFPLLSAIWSRQIQKGDIISQGCTWMSDYSSLRKNRTLVFPRLLCLYVFQKDHASYHTWFRGALTQVSECHLVRCVASALIKVTSQTV